MIYLASPYSHPDKAVELRRYDETVRALAHLCLLGLPVFSPIAMCHEAATRHGLPTDAKWWEDFNAHFMARSDACVVLMIDGWRESKGVAHEIKWFRDRCFPVQGLRPNSGDFEWATDTIVSRVDAMRTW